MVNINDFKGWVNCIFDPFEITNFISMRHLEVFQILDFFERQF